MSSEPPEFENAGNASRRPKQQQQRGKTALYKANVVKTVSTAAPAITDDAILLKIQKCFDRGKNPTTSEHEAKAALCVASQLMAKYNVSQAQLLAQEEASDRVSHAAQRDVDIDREDGDGSKPVRLQGYVDSLCAAMETFFNCKYYTTAGYGSVKVSFYGIDANAAAAADAFEMTFNLIAEWALAHKGNGPRESYCLGISRELRRMAEREELAEEAKAVQVEEAARRQQEAQEAVEQQARLARLTSGGDPHGGTSSVDDTRSNHDISSEKGREEVDGSEHEDVDDLSDEESSMEPTFKIENDGDSLGDFDDVDEMIRRLVKQESQPPHNEKPAEVETQAAELPMAEHSSAAGPDLVSVNGQSPLQKDSGGWTSRNELVLFRNTAKAVADEYLKTNNITLYSSTRRSSNVRDWSAYYQGVSDSQKIDVRGRIKRIKA